MNAAMLAPIPQGTRSIAFDLYSVVTTIAKKGIAPVKTAAMFLEIGLSFGFSARSAFPVTNQ